MLHDKEVNQSMDIPVKDRNTKEVEAESVAFTVCQHFGIDTSDYSFGYIAGWSSGRNMKELKSSLEGKAEHLADKLVPYSLGGTILTYLLTRNVTKALSILMVDYSCALKLAMPISVLSAIREASLYNVTVKGGKYLEAVAEADTIVFDKTGTLTKAKPTVVDVVSFNGESTDELLRIAACLEEHFPHSMAKAVTDLSLIHISEPTRH